MDYGKLYKTEDGYVVFLGTEDEYGVAPDPKGLGCKYDYDDVVAYAEAHPEMIVSGDYGMEESDLRNELSSLKQYLTDTDWCVIKCLELGVSAIERYPDVVSKRSEARSRINEIEMILNTGIPVDDGGTE